MYPGGKGHVFQKIINQIPSHKRYFELFLGDGAVMRNKRPARRNTGYDLDKAALARVTSGIAENGDAEVTSYLTMIPDYEFHQGCGLRFLEGFTFELDDFVYLDPPYLMHTRRCQRPLYEYEFSTLEEHGRLLAAIVDLPCMVAISGYWSELYAEKLAGWRTISFEAMTRGGTMATEWLWMNYDDPVRLHDYRYLGDNFRERERIKRKAQRWVAGLQRLPILEQQAILAGMQGAGLVD